jgi:hypothetical protein
VAEFGFRLRQAFSLVQKNSEQAVGRSEHCMFLAESRAAARNAATQEGLAFASLLDSTELEANERGQDLGIFVVVGPSLVQEGGSFEQPGCCSTQPPSTAKHFAGIF